MRHGSCRKKVKKTSNGFKEKYNRIFGPIMQQDSGTDGSTCILSLIKSKNMVRLVKWQEVGCWEIFI